MTKTHNPGGDMEIPKDIAQFVAKCPRLLPGETEQKYYELFDLLMEEIRPGTTTEWLALADIVALYWDIVRYQAWKGAILNIYRRDALETALRVTHHHNPMRGNAPGLIFAARKEAEKWLTDPATRADLNVRLVENGYDEETLNAGAFQAALEPLSNIERSLSSARRQLNSMLKEFHVRREFADRACQALDERLKAVEAAPKLKQIGPN